MSEREAWQVTDDAAVLYEKSFVPAIFAHCAVQIVDAAGIGRGDRVLDVGCGTGIVAREAAKRVGPEGSVIGLDLNPRMLEVARRVAPDIEWRNGDAAELPFDDGAFEIVVSQCALMFVPDPARALREMWRVLAPGGRLAVAVCGPIDEAAGYAALVEVGERVCTPEVVALLRSPFALGDQERLAALVQAAGVEHARIENRHCPVSFPSIEALVRTEVMASPIRDVIAARDYDALLEGAGEGLRGHHGEGGAVAFPMSLHFVTASKA